MGTNQSPKESLCRCPIPPRLQVDIYDLAILIHCSPQVVLFAIYLYEHFVNVECVTVASVFSLQSSRV
jgi:hypothetical protein